MLVYPDIFKVAVSNAGNHDNSVYNRWWSEKHNGVKENISDKTEFSPVCCWLGRENSLRSPHIKNRNTLSNLGCIFFIHIGNFF